MDNIEYVVTVSPEWLAACGYQRLTGKKLRALKTAGERVHNSRMGRCFEVALPDGRMWTTFECRLDNVIEVKNMEEMLEAME